MTEMSEKLRAAGINTTAIRLRSAASDCLQKAKMNSVRAVELFMQALRGDPALIIEMHGGLDHHRKLAMQILLELLEERRPKPVLAVVTPVPPVRRANPPRSPVAIYGRVDAAVARRVTIKLLEDHIDGRRTGDLTVREAAQLAERDTRRGKILRMMTANQPPDLTLDHIWQDRGDELNALQETISHED